MAELKPEQIRECISAQICPWCRAGPFRCLAVHTWRAHSITAEAVRIYAEYPKCETICSEERSEAQRAANLRRPDINEKRMEELRALAAKVERGKAPQRAMTKRRRSAASKEAARKRAGNSLCTLRRIQANAHRIKIFRSEYPVIVRKFKEGMTEQAIAQEYQCSRELIKEILKRTGNKTTEEEMVQRVIQGNRRWRDSLTPEGKAEYQRKLSEAQKVANKDPRVIKHRIDSQAHRTKVPRSKHDEIMSRRQKGETYPQIAATYGCSPGLISQIVHGRRREL